MKRRRVLLWLKDIVIASLVGPTLEIGDTTVEAIRKKLNPNANGAFILDVSLTLRAAHVSDIDIVTERELASPLQSAGAVLEHVRSFLDILSPIAELVPLGKTAVDVMNGLLNVVERPVLNDELIRDLLLTVQDTYDFLKYHDEILQDHEDAPKRVAFLFKQTAECASFIREYSQQSTSEKIFHNSEAMIQCFKDKFTSLKSAWTANTSLDIKLMTYRTCEKVDATYDFTVLNAIPHHVEQGYDPVKKCWPGTRKEIVEEIDQWIQSAYKEDISSFDTSTDNATRLCILYGQAGKGKSSIANSIALSYDSRERNQLDLSFKFSAGARRRNLFGALSRNLADRSPVFRESLQALVSKDTKRRESTETLQQFQLLVDAIKDLQIIGPIVVVIDTLDEADDEERRRLLLILFRRLGELPKNFRILVTARPTRDINDRLNKVGENVLKINLDSFDPLTVSNDIEKFVSGSLSRLDAPFARAQVIRTIVTNSEGLFLFASLVCDAFLDPRGRLHTQLLANLDEITGLYQLYEGIINGTFDFNPKDTAHRADVQANFRLVMGFVFAADPGRPLSLSILKNLVPKSWEQVNAIVPLMGSLLTGTRDSNRLIVPVHSSFREFLATTPDFDSYIDAGHRRLASAALDYMDKKLRFNLCNLTISSLRNQDQPDLPAKIAAQLDSTLEYACMTWSYHASECKPLDATLKGSLKKFLETNLLFWFEALSMLGRVNDGIYILRRLVNNVGHDSQLEPLARDALEFILRFSPIMASFTPHIYLSALPFAPIKSWIRRHYLPKYSGLHTIHHTQNEWWSGREVLLGRPVAVRALAVSGRWLGSDSIVSSSDDHILTIWDISSKSFKVLDEHGPPIIGVSYSQNGQILSCSNNLTVRIWDPDSGAQDFENYKLGPPSGASGASENKVTTVAFSPDDQTLASGSFESPLITVWNFLSGDSFEFKGHSEGITALAFSPDGNSLLSGSADRKLMHWDLKTRSAITFTGHSDTILSVAFSPDGRKVASGSADKTLRIWDIEKQQETHLLTDHSDRVTSVAFFPYGPGRRLVSGSADETIRLWDISTEGSRSVVLDGEADRVNAVVFSNDGRSVISGSDDHKVRVSDVSWQNFARLETSPAVAISYTDQEAVRPMENPGVWSDLGTAPDSIENFEISRVIFSSETSKAMLFSADTSTWSLWNWSNSQSTPFEGVVGPRAVTLSQDGQVALGLSTEHTKIWDIETNRISLLDTLGHEIKRILQLSPDRNYVLCESESLMLWNMKDLEEPLILEDPGVDYDRRVFFSNDGTKIFACSRNGHLILWDIHSPQPSIVQGEIGDDDNAILEIVSSADRRRICIGCRSGHLVIWDVDLQSSGVVKAHSDWVRALSFSPDGKNIASGSDDRKLKIWDAESHTEIHSFERHSDWILDIAYSSNGSKVAAGLDDGSIRVWDVISGTSVVLKGHTQGVYTIGFSPDGSKLFSFSLDHSLRLWVLPSAMERSDSDADYLDGQIHLSSWHNVTLNRTNNAWLNTDETDDKTLLLVPSHYAPGLLYCGQSTVLGLSPVTRIKTHPDLIRNPSNWTKCLVQSESVVPL